MLKKLMLLVTAATAVLAFGAQGASANWYHGVNALTAGQNPHLVITGPAKFTSANGGTSCAASHATVQATGGTTTGHVIEFTPTNLNTCEVSGGLVFLTGGTTTLKSSTLVGTPLVHLIEKEVGGVKKHHLSVTGITLHNEYTNGFKLNLTSIESKPVTISLNQQTGAISSGTLEGPLSSSLGEVTAHVGVEVDSPTYGVTPG